MTATDTPMIAARRGVSSVDQNGSHFCSTGSSGNNP
jgi:hypothetical protein